MKAFCTQCGQQIEDRTIYCPKCGALSRRAKETRDAVLRLKDGDKEAFSWLYEDTYPYFLSVCRHTMGDSFRIEDAEDILQSVYVKLFNSIDSLKEPEKFQTWGKTAVVHAALDFLARKKPALMESEDLIDYLDADPDTDRDQINPEAIADKKETVRIVREILKELPQDQQLCIYLFYMEGLSIREIAEQTGVSENTVKSRLNYGKKKIQVKVLELEKSGIRLHSMAPVAFFLGGFRLLLDDETASAAENAELFGRIRSGVKMPASGNAGGGRDTSGSGARGGRDTAGSGARGGRDASGADVRGGNRAAGAKAQSGAQRGSSTRTAGSPGRAGLTPVNGEVLRATLRDAGSIFMKYPGKWLVVMLLAGAGLLAARQVLKPRDSTPPSVATVSTTSTETETERMTETEQAAETETEWAVETETEWFAETETEQAAETELAPETEQAPETERPAAAAVPEDGEAKAAGASSYDAEYHGDADYTSDRYLEDFGSYWYNPYLARMAEENRETVVPDPLGHLYYVYLTEGFDMYSSNATGFSLAYIDGDDIPELTVRFNEPYSLPDGYEGIKSNVGIMAYDPSVDNIFMRGVNYFGDSYPLKEGHILHGDLDVLRDTTYFEKASLLHESSPNTPETMGSFFTRNSKVEDIFYDLDYVEDGQGLDRGREFLWHGSTLDISEGEKKTEYYGRPLYEGETAAPGSLYDDSYELTFFTDQVILSAGEYEDMLSDRIGGAPEKAFTFYDLTEENLRKYLLDNEDLKEPHMDSSVYSQYSNVDFRLGNGVSRSIFEGYLKEEGFDGDTIEEILAGMDQDWTFGAVIQIVHNFEKGEYPAEACAEALSHTGFTDQEVAKAVAYVFTRLVPTVNGESYEDIRSALWDAQRDVYYATRSRQAIIENIEDRYGFDESLAKAIVGYFTPDWNYRAVRAAEVYASGVRCSRDEARDYLIRDMKFTPDECEYAIANADIEWEE